MLSLRYLPVVSSKKWQSRGTIYATCVGLCLLQLFIHFSLLVVYTFNSNHLEPPSMKKGIFAAKDFVDFLQHSPSNYALQNVIK